MLELLVQLDLGEFEGLNGLPLPESMVKMIEIPRQMASQEEAEAIDEGGTAVGGSTSTFMGANFSISVLYQ